MKKMRIVSVLMVLCLLAAALVPFAGAEEAANPNAQREKVNIR